MGIMVKKDPTSYREFVLLAVLNIKDYRKGASRPAIKKYIESNHKKVLNASALRTALAKAVAVGTLIQEGQRFKLTSEKRAELRKPAPKPKKKKKKVVKKKKTKKKTAKKKTKKKKTKKNGEEEDKEKDGQEHKE